MKRVAALLITFALIAGMVGCPAAPEPTPPNEYTLTISSSEGGSVTAPGEGTFTYDDGGVVDLMATAASGYSFAGWTGDVGTIANVRATSTTITMNGDYSITADFQVIPFAKYSLTVSSTEGGLVTVPGEGSSVYDAGTVVELAAEPEEGYQFTHWTGSVGAVDDVNAASTTVTMIGDYTITANFAKEIRTWYDLHAIRDNPSGHYVLTNNLDAATAGYAELAGPTANGGQGWQPIGLMLTDPANHYVTYPVDPFTGSFNGQHYEVNGLSISRPDQDGVGLFAGIGEGGLVQNLGVADSEVAGYRRVGAVAGLNYGTLRNCYSDGDVSGTWGAGGLVGEISNGTLSSSYFTGSVTSEDMFVGGLVGVNHGRVNNSHYSYDGVLINGKRIITIGALPDEDFEDWLANGKSLDVNARLGYDDGYYVINSVSDFEQLLAFGQDASLKFRLSTDLDLAGEPDFYIPYLAGEFNGNGHEISNLNFSFSFLSQVGLFGYLASGATVNQLSVENVNVVGHQSVGGLVGASRGVVANSDSSGIVIGGGSVGGLVGTSWGNVSNSRSTATVTGDIAIGGLVGGSWSGTLSNSFFTGTVTGGVGTGGLVGFNHAIVRNSHYSYDDVLINGKRMITIGALRDDDFQAWLANDKHLDVNARLSHEGGYYPIHNVSDLKELLAFGQDSSLKFRLKTDLDLAGEPDFYIPYLGGEFDGDGHRILNLNLNAKFISQVGLFGYIGPGARVSAVGVENANIIGGWNVGGVAGGNAGTVTNSYSTGIVTGDLAVGGLVGSSDWGWKSTVSDCYSTCRTTGHRFVGGLIGLNRGGTVRNSYSVGIVIANQYAGGLVGSNNSPLAAVRTSFWDIQTSGLQESDAGTGKTTIEMQSIAAFSGGGWSIATVAPGERNTAYIWNVVDGQTYPFLSWQPVT